MIAEGGDLDSLCRLILNLRAEAVALAMDKILLMHKVRAEADSETWDRGWIGRPGTGAARAGGGVTRVPCHVPP